ncbi:unnamed protein product [Linum trigynum]|uniref:Bifunctional inhibitor/plant lipid transfer protein/seed storage helical domain-containing protein n=1 Tax=Linum trigynum TaxID=586398 RepID=A0AAV2FJX5_9ROSI
MAAMLRFTLPIAAAAFLLVAIATTEASSMRRTTVIIDQQNQGRGGGSGTGEEGGGRRCREQFVEQGNLWHCQSFMAEHTKQGGGTKHLKSCCKQLKKMDMECTCKGLELSIRQMEAAAKQGEMQGEDMKLIWRIASNLPGACKTSPATCDEFAGHGGGGSLYLALETLL